MQSDTGSDSARSGTLTPKQLKILQYIEKEITRSGAAPTYRAIAQHFHLKAVGTVQDHIAKLVENGYLVKDPRRNRGLQLPFQERVVWVPILGQVPAGNPTEAFSEALGSLTLTGNVQGNLFALQVKGASMKDRGILDRDFVVVRPQPDAESGEIVVAVIDQEATVKTLEKSRGKIWLVPANTDFQPLQLVPGRENRIVGKVVAVHRTYS